MAILERFGKLVNSVTARWSAHDPQAAMLASPSKTSEVEPADQGWGNNTDIFDPLGEFGSFAEYAIATRILRTRIGWYQEYDEMDEELPEFHSALDIIADNATRGDADGEDPIVIKCADQRVTKVLTALKDRLRLSRGLWTLARDITKYGERAEEVIVDDQFNIVRLKPLPTQYIIPQRDKWGWTDPKRAYKQVNDAGEVLAEFAEWQVIFWANVKSAADVTGTGVGYAIRRAFKQLRMMEDAVVIARLTRAHNRLAYMVDTGSMTPEEAQKHIRKVKNALRKRRTISQTTGKMDLSHNPLGIEEDIFVATSKESKADVKVLQGDLTVGNLADLEYFQQKIFTGLKVPKPYLAHEKDSRAKSVMTEQDIQFARSVRRIQSVIHEGLRKLFDFALTLQGIDPTKTPYTIGLPIISIVDDLRVWQTWQLKMLCAQMMKQVFWPSDEWILTKMLGFATDEVQQLIAGQVKPDKFNGLYQAPKVGAVANNAKAATTDTREAVTLAELHAALAAADPAEREQFESLVTELRELYTESLQRRSAA